MKRHLIWRIVLGLLLLAWVPIIISELIDKLRGLTSYTDQAAALMFGFVLFVWWPCHILVVLILLYKLLTWVIKRVGMSKA